VVYVFSGRRGREQLFAAVDALTVAAEFPNQFGATAVDAHTDVFDDGFLLVEFMHDSRPPRSDIARSILDLGDYLRGVLDGGREGLRFAFTMFAGG
jgi:hypothetical protein